jgi:hypothetical protein
LGYFCVGFFESAVLLVDEILPNVGENASEGLDDAGESILWAALTEIIQKILSGGLDIHAFCLLLVSFVLHCLDDQIGESAGDLHSLVVVGREGCEGLPGLAPFALELADEGLHVLSTPVYFASDGVKQAPCERLIIHL